MATRYWVGGSGTWNASNTANWSASTGGASGASAPVAADTVIFDSASGTGTCTTASGAVCSIATLNTSTLGLTLGANLTLGSSFTLTLGALDLNNNILTVGNQFLSTNSNVRSIAFGTGSINLTANNTTIWSTSTATNFSYTGTPTINATYSGATGTRAISHGTTGGTETNTPNFNITAGTDIVTVTNAGTLNFTGFTGTLGNSTRTVYKNLTFTSGMTCTAGTLATTFGATSGTQSVTTNGNSTIDFPITINAPGATVQLQDNLTIGSTRSVTFTAGTLDLSNGNRTLSSGNWSSSNSNTRAILFGTGSLNLTNSGTTIFSMSTATGFTYTGTPTVNLTYSGSTGSRTVTFGSTGGTETNAPSFNVSAGSDALVFSARAKNLNFTGFSGTLSPSTLTVYGNLIISSGMSTSSGGSLAFAGTSGTQQITTAGKTLDFAITFDGVGGTFTFQDALTMGSTRALTLTNGTLKLKSGATSTVGSFVTSGTNQKYLAASTSGTQATISDASGVNSVSYLTISDSFATGGATWDAFYDNNNVDFGNNTNWEFGEAPTIGNEIQYKLRSFTEPRRF